MGPKKHPTIYLEFAKTIPGEDRVRARRIIRAAWRGLNRDPLNGIEVHIRAAKPGKFAGHSYCGVPERANVQPGTRRLITMRITPSQDWLPRPWVYKVRARPYAFATWDEEVFHLAAHEIWHQHQFTDDMPCSEVDAENRATAALDRWRQRHVRTSDLIRAAAKK